MKILVVEDETAVAMMMVHVLNRVGCDVQAAWRAAQALDVAATTEFDLITLDINLAGVDGFEIYRQMRQVPHLQHTPIVFVSGTDTDENRQRAALLGAADFIAKPFAPSAFVHRILSLLEGKMPMRAW